jgi:threonine dehydrogenase-like Zn-dependent dehydrogenase
MVGLLVASGAQQQIGDQCPRAGVIVKLAVPTGADTTPMLLKLVASGKLKVDSFATHHFKLHEMMDAYDTFSRAAETKALKVIIDR